MRYHHYSQTYSSFFNLSEVNALSGEVGGSLNLHQDQEAWDEDEQNEEDE